MADNSKIEPIETEEKPKSKPKQIKPKIVLRDDMYLALHGLYSSVSSIKRGDICFIVGDERIEKLLEVNAIRKIDDIELSKLDSISRYRKLITNPGYGSAGDFLSQSDTDIMQAARIPQNLVDRIRNLITQELTK